MADRLFIDVRAKVGSLELAATIDAGSDAIAFVGPSGAGKSTLVRILAGLERRGEGEVRLGAEVWQSASGDRFVPPWDRRIGWVPQDALLFPHLNVRDNLAFAGAAQTDVAEFATRFEVAHLLGRRPRNLSGGERQRAALARALLVRPALLLLDEPFSALDRPLRRALGERVRETAREIGASLVLVSHDEEDAEILECERWRVVGGLVERG